MKKSNFALSIVATFAIGVAVGTTVFTAPVNPTSVAYVPMEENRPSVLGGGYLVSLPQTPTERQKHILQVAYEVAVENNWKYPQLLQAIVMQESRAGTADHYTVAGPSKEPYYGIGQVKLSAAHAVLNKWPAFFEKFGFQTRSDDEIKAHLILDDRFNVSVMERYLSILKGAGYNTPEKLAVAYQAGIGGGKGLEKTPYSDSVINVQMPAVYKIAHKG